MGWVLPKPSDAYRARYGDSAAQKNDYRIFTIRVESLAPSVSREVL